MAIDKKIILGVLTFLILTSGVILVNFTDENLKMRIDNDKSTFYTLENSYWRVSGREVNSLWDGSSKMNRDKNSIDIASYFNNDTLEGIIVEKLRTLEGQLL